MRFALPTTLAVAGVAVLFAAGCGSSPQPPTRKAGSPAAVAASDETLPATFEEAKSLAVRRDVPLLVDFYSPT